MSEKKEIQIVPVDELNLVVNEMTIGKLTTNAKEVLNQIKENVKNYSVENFKGDAKKAAEEKAKFNNLAKALNDTRIAYEKKWNEPFTEFKDTVTEAVNLIKNECSAKLDVIVKEKEKEEKDKKRAEIADIWKIYEFNLVPLEKIFNDKWLNKTYKTKQIHDDIAHIIDRITGDLQSIEQFGEDTDTLKELYLTTLDLQSTLRRGAELRENRKRLAEEAERKAKEEAERQAALMQKANEPEIPQTVTKTEERTPEPTYNVNFDTHEVTEVQPPKSEQPKEPTYTFYVTMPVAAIAKECGIESAPIFMSATKTQLLNFKEALAKNGYEYDKLAYGNKLLLNVRVKGRK